MPYHYTDQSRREDPHALPDVEVFDAYDNASMGDWYYAHGSPGCLWDSDPVGPFDTEVEALEAAREAAGLCPHGVPYERPPLVIGQARECEDCGSYVTECRVDLDGTHCTDCKPYTVCEECPAPELWAWDHGNGRFAHWKGSTDDPTKAMAWGSESAARESAGRMAFCDGGVPRRLSDADARRWGKSS